MVHQEQIAFETSGHRHMVDLTDQVAAIVEKSGIKVGILHSLSGTMAISETALKETALMTIAEINAKIESGQAVVLTADEVMDYVDRKGLASAGSNAGQVDDLEEDVQELVVGEIFVDAGPMLKRWRPRAQGRAFPIHKPMTNITVVVEDQEA